MDEITHALELLADTPRRLAAISRNADDRQLYDRQAAAGWSANDILAHLRACADVWGKSILAMIAQDHPTMRYLSPRTWVRKTNYAELDFHESLDAFCQQRMALLKTLRDLKREAWSRGATFTATVRGREQTILSLARRMADHEQEHCEQLALVLKPPETPGG